MMDKFLIVLCTFAEANLAQKTAETLVREKLAACCNIIPNLISIYDWQGQLQHDSEVLMIAKTEQARYRALEKRILELHPYEVPEVIAVPIEQGSAAYLNWIKQVLKND